MKTTEIETLVTEIAENIAKEFDIEIDDVEYVKEGKDYFLRVFIDKPGGVNIDDCENISRKLSQTLDETDPIPDAYYLEVSSPGLDKQLKKEKDFIKYNGYNVDVKFYKPLNGSKILTGKLTGYDNGTVTVVCTGEELKFSLKETVYIKLAVEF